MNSTTLNDFEIMAPVGSRESLAAAIQAERVRTLFTSVSKT